MMFGGIVVLGSMINLSVWIPRLNDVGVFRWFILDRRELAWMALLAPMIMTPLICRLDQRRKQGFVTAFLVLLLGYYAVLPFLAPALSYSRHAQIITDVDFNGVCYQSTDYNCGPAAAVTALRKRGVPAEESALALRGYTSFAGGTPLDMLSMAIREEYGVENEILYKTDLSQLVGREPWIALVKFAPRVDHYVTVLAVTESLVVVGDPLIGTKKFSHSVFEEEWRKAAIVFEAE